MSLMKFLRRRSPSPPTPSPVAEPGRELPPDYYDSAFQDPKTGFDVHYTQSRYYFLWTVIVDRIARDARVLEIGCGPGQFANLLTDRGVRSYRGFDFSPVAVRMASKRCPGLEFSVDNALTTDLLRRDDFDTVVCTEVLEHVETDLRILDRVPRGVVCHITVPNFPFRSHVRHFASAEEAANRYGPFLDHPRVDTFLENPQGKKYFLLSGKRNSHALPPEGGGQPT